MFDSLIVIAVVVAVLLIVLSSTVKVVQEYERGVVFRLGRLLGPRGPGLILLIPFLERMQKVDLRTVTMDIPAQEVITADNVTVRVNAVAYFRVLDPNAAIVNVADFIRATSQIAQTTLRSVLGQSSLDDLLSERDKINVQLQQIIDEQTEPWGVKVGIVEVKDVELPQSMQRAMARQAEAEREKRAKIIHAEGEFQASQQLAEAAEVINRNPVTIQLRYLQTLTEIGAEKNTTVVFPLPIDLVQAFMGQGSSQRPVDDQPVLAQPPTASVLPAAPAQPVAPRPAAADD
jgi:regulator of protease activity HflC (stomatin/prohibitin superfamily)